MSIGTCQHGQWRQKYLWTRQGETPGSIRSLSPASKD
jgi:hypothetical protein